MSTQSIFTAAVALALAWQAPLAAQEQGGRPAPDMTPGAAHLTAIEIGEPTPDFVLNSIDNERYELSVTRGDKPLLLLFFRGTW